MPVVKQVSTFFAEDMPSYASYDNIRKIASYVDGLKISMRKILYTLMEKYPTKEKTKTDTVANTCAAYTNYLHGSQNMCSVCNTLAQSFVGANNYPLLEGNSSGFGTRINPECAASRYTKVALSPIVESLFNAHDIEIAGRQYFEGSYIEPKFFVPIFPILFLNGSHGVSTGFSQDIYPRNPQEIIDYIEAKLKNKKYKGELLPWFKGFQGTIKINPENHKTECWGNVVKNNMTSYTITEIPIGIEYQKYLDILDKLCDNNIIVDYEDKCDTKTDNILFEIKTTREFTRTYDTDEKLYAALKLIKTLPETLCCVDENNRVKEYSSIQEILDDFINIRLDTYEKRKQYILEESSLKLDTLKSKYFFCSAIIHGKIIIANKNKAEIINQLLDCDEIIKVDGSFNYLLNLPIHSISKETVAKIKADIKELESYIQKVKEKDEVTMWKEDLEKFKQAIMEE